MEPDDGASEQARERRLRALRDLARESGMAAETPGEARLSESLSAGLPHARRAPRRHGLRTVLLVGHELARVGAVLAVRLQSGRGLPSDAWPALAQVCRICREVEYVSGERAGEGRWSRRQARTDAHRRAPAPYVTMLCIHKALWPCSASS